MSKSADRLNEFAAATTLESIVLREVTARRAQPEETIPEQGSIALRIDEPDLESEMPRNFAVGLRVTLRSPSGVALVEPVGRYHVDKAYEADLDEDLLLEFANVLGVAMLVPYARQALSDITRRVFESEELMPMFAPGELYFEKPSPSSDA